MSDTLARICDDKREHIARCKDAMPLSDMEARAVAAPRVRTLAQCLADDLDPVGAPRGDGDGQCAAEVLGKGDTERFRGRTTGIISVD